MVVGTLEALPAQRWIFYRIYTRQVMCGEKLSKTYAWFPMRRKMAKFDDFSITISRFDTQYIPFLRDWESHFEAFDMSFRCPIKTRSWGRPYASPCAEVFQCKSLRPRPELSQGGFLGAKFYLRNSFIKELEQSINLAFYAPQGLNVIFNIKHLFLSLSPWVNCEQPVIGAGVCKNDQAVQRSLNILFELTVTPILAVSTTAFPGYQI